MQKNLESEFEVGKRFIDIKGFIHEAISIHDLYGDSGIKDEQGQIHSLDLILGWADPVFVMLTTKTKLTPVQLQEYDIYYHRNRR